ncbi:MAG: riboflavin synthase [Elusimicrobiota bacterium]
MGEERGLMFTGIIQKMGTVAANRARRSGARGRSEWSTRGGRVLSVRAGLGRLPRGASVAINGTCLTVTRRRDRTLDFDVSQETLRLTNLGRLRPGDAVNLETPLKASDFIGGHWVSGHVDACGPVLEREDLSGGFVRMRVRLPRGLRRFVALKGSIAVDGTSLTVTGVGRDWFETVLIPETLQKTTLGARRPGDPVNLEVDLMARYIVNVLKGLKR